MGRRPPSTFVVWLSGMGFSFGGGGRGIALMRKGSEGVEGV